MRFVVMAAILVALSACAGPMARRDAPEHLALVQEFGGAYQSSDLEAYVERVGERVARAAGAGNRFAFTVLDDETPNALSLPSGHIYVTRGLLALVNSEAELAGVLAHEIAHVTAGHAAARMRQAMADVMAIAALESAGVDPQLAELAAMQALARQQLYSQDQEFAADEDAIRIMRGAGYDPRALAGVLQTLVAQEMLQTRIDGTDGRGDFLSSHPRTADRAARVAAVAMTVPGGRIGHDDHLRAVNGLIYGQDPTQGVLRGSRFLHPTLGFTFTIPEGFIAVNENDTVLALHPSGALLLLDSDTVPGGVDMARYLQQTWLTGVDLYGLSPARVGDMPAAMAEVHIDSNFGPMRGRAVAVRFDHDTVYRFLLATPADAGAAVARMQAEAVASFRRLTPAEAAQIRPYRLHTVQVPPGTAVEQLAAAVPGEASAEHLRVLNGLAPGEVLAGGLAKIYTE